MFLLAALVYLSGVHASENGGYYVCDFDSNGHCIFVLSGNQPASWTSLVEHNVDRSGQNYKRKVVDSAGSTLSVTPKPWTNGDNVVTSTTDVTGDDWSYTLIAELVFPLRNKIMYSPSDLVDANEWSKYTKAFKDCSIKMTTETYEEEGRTVTAAGTEDVWDYMKNPDGKDIHHYVLQYLEEGAIDLVCLATDLEMSRCDTIRGLFSIEKGTKCNCWFDAYEEIYGSAPAVDQTFTTCTADVVNEPEEETTTSTEQSQTGPFCCDGSIPNMSTSPPTCDDGSNAQPPSGSCPETTTTTTPTPTSKPTVPPTTTTTESTPTSPFCCDGSEPNMSFRPPKCEDGSTAQPPTGSCDDDAHSNMSNCPMDTTSIRFPADGVYVCEGATECGQDTQVCSENEIEGLDAECSEGTSCVVCCDKEESSEMPDTTKMPTSCDATESCTESCQGEPTTCEEFQAMTADDGCAANCCESFTKPYGDALCSEQASICPADMVLNEEASYMDMTTNQETNCGVANTYCGMNDCGDKTALQTYFKTTDCCERDNDATGSSICPADMVLNKEASYTDMETNQVINCGDADTWCGMNDCGDKTTLQTYFKTTDCCQGGSDPTGAPERNVCTATFDECINAYSSGEYRVGVAADAGFFPCNYEDETCASNEYQSKVCRSGMTTLSGEVLDELRCFGCIDFSGCCDNDLFLMAALAPYPAFSAIQDCQIGIAMMSARFPKEQLCAMTWGDLARANGIAVDESVTTTLKVGEICGSSCGHECRQGTREPIDETKQPTEAETTKAPSDGCSCEDMVSMEDFEALREAVRELQGSIGTIEADNNDLMDGMMEMATCMSGMTDKFGKDTTMMPTEDSSTKMPTDRETSSSMMPTDRETSSTMMPTDRETSSTMMPTDRETTQKPTEEWETWAELWVDPVAQPNENNKCSTSRDDRAFKLTFTNTANCLSRCKNDATCVYATTEKSIHCIGCRTLNQRADGWYAYKINGKEEPTEGARRELSEIEQLRAENAALKAELARRN